MAKKTKSAKRERARERREMRFDPVASVSPAIAYALGAVGATVMGAGAWAQFGSSFGESAVGPIKAAPYLLMGGALLVAAAIWLGTSAEAAIRVGDGGIGVDKGEIRRMPWYAVGRIEWRAEAVRVVGKDESGQAMTVVASLKTNPQAAAWIVREARERVPASVDVPGDATLPEARGTDAIVLEAPQVVGRRCAESNEVIAYEPDARLCPRCERVYHKAHVPLACACGAPLDQVALVVPGTPSERD